MATEKQYLLEIERECRLLLADIPETHELYGYRASCLKYSLSHLAKYRENREEVNRCKAIEKSNQHMNLLFNREDNING